MSVREDFVSMCVCVCVCVLTGSWLGDMTRGWVYARGNNCVISSAVIHVHSLRISGSKPVRDPHGGEVEVGQGSFGEGQMKR